MSATGASRMPVELRVWLFEDAGPTTESGRFAFYYAGWDYELTVDGRVYSLRRYRDEPNEVAFHGTMQEPTPSTSRDRASDSMMPRDGVPYGDPLFENAARWLLAQPEIAQLTVFTTDPDYPGQAYIPVDPSRFSTLDRIGASDLGTGMESLDSDLDRFLGVNAPPMSLRRWPRHAADAPPRA